MPDAVEEGQEPEASQTPRSPAPNGTSDAKVTTTADERQDLMKKVLSVGGSGVGLFARFFGSKDAQKAAGRKKPKEKLVRHGPIRHKDRRTLKDRVLGLWRMIWGLLPFLSPAIAYRLFGEDYETFGAYIVDHLTLLLIPLLPIIGLLWYAGRNYSRTHPTQQKGKPKRYPKPALPPATQWNKDVNDIVANLDNILLRLVFWAGLAGSVYVTGEAFPVSVGTFEGVASQVSGDNWGETLQPVLVSVLTPITAYVLTRLRCDFVIRNRFDEISECHEIARDTLGYITKEPQHPSPRQMVELTPWLAVKVKKWSALYEIDRAFVVAPSALSTNRISEWDEFTANMNTKMPRPEEWRIERDPKGRGAFIGPANYPTSVLWDGQIDPDPLTFWIGVNLETGENAYLTFSDVSPHMALSGGTASGKLIHLSTIVQTPSGPRYARDLKLGDELFDERGRVVQITAMSEIETPETAYRVTFHDGTSVVVDSRHPWTTWDRAARRAASRQRKQGPTRARQPWLSDEQRAILSAEIEMTAEGDDISRTQVAALLGIGKDTAPLVEVAEMVGVCREQAITKEFAYAEQVMKQEQTCMVFDRSEVQTLVTALANSPRAGVREAAKTVKVLERNGSGPVSVPELVKVTGIDRTRMRGLVKRSGVKTLRKERITVDLTVPGKVVSRTSPQITRFYPKRPLLEALLQRGLMDKHDQRDKMALPAVRTTQEIADTLRYRAAGADEDAQSWANHSIPRAGAAQFPEVDLPLDPYVLGAWLGDGTSDSGEFTGIDPEITDEIGAAGYEVTHSKTEAKRHHIKGIVKPLRAAGVLGNKHLPDAYLYASIEQRLALLQGLMDTDGSVNRTSGTCEFYQSDEALARQVRSLVASLGMIAHIRSKPGGYRDALTGEFVPCKVAWTVSFTPTMQVFRLPRKAALIDPEANRSKVEHRYIVAVEPVEPEPMRCIMVNSDSHQFLVTDQYVPTHNTSLAEVIAAQVLIKQMPWDPSLTGQVHIVDPKGPFARRWLGRPGVVVSNGQADGTMITDDGDEENVTGPVIMGLHMEEIEREHRRRAAVLARYPDVATWMHLPEEVKRRERFFPIFVVLDEYIDHTDKEKANGDERIEQENFYRDVITRMASWHARKYRNVGMHTILIAQEVKMTGNTGIGSALMRNLPVRAITGQMDPSQIQTMFGTTEVPTIPSTRYVVVDGVRQEKTIPGRARIMNALGQPIRKIQVPWFGGEANNETLDKWLPRGEQHANGDFSLPPGRPRKPSDFDSEGNFVGSDAPVAPETPPADHPAWDEAPEHGEASDPVRKPNLDTSSVFPAAGDTEEVCSEKECVDDAAETCSVCGKALCMDHAAPSPDPAEDTFACEACNKSHPLIRAEMESVYQRIYSMAVKNGLAPSYEEVDPDGVKAVVRTPEGKKVVEVTSSGKIITARSKSGMVEGEAESLDRAQDAIDNYVASLPKSEEE